MMAIHPVKWSTGSSLCDPRLSHKAHQLQKRPPRSSHGTWNPSIECLLHCLQVASLQAVRLARLNNHSHLMRWSRLWHSTIPTILHCQCSPLMSKACCTLL